MLLSLCRPYTSAEYNSIGCTWLSRINQVIWLSLLTYRTHSTHTRFASTPRVTLIFVVKTYPKINSCTHLPLRVFSRQNSNVHFCPESLLYWISYFFVLSVFTLRNTSLQTELSTLSSNFEGPLECQTISSAKSSITSCRSPGINWIPWVPCCSRDITISLMNIESKKKQDWVHSLASIQLDSPKIVLVCLLLWRKKQQTRAIPKGLTFGY